ncbi:hypothetical protein C4Q28_04870 [Pseudomonas sp. SWI6]|uniref:hypothetical protein n=1 Tax=Pseudomonas sp. SWI6 TaxID=2083051 RepID=UPI000CE5D93D|nr:hypothetical protein [Pseudomonas sp. SWI6]AVD81538.1 hypothetical protein C4Q28_04870 [Pseudomonas sp. SWI6]
MTIAARIQECTAKLAVGDAENAFIQLAIAIDGTAKLLYPGKKTSERCKKFLKDSLPFILWSLTNGTPAKTTSLLFEVSNSNDSGEFIEFEDLVYRVMRCSLLHEGELSDKVEFVNASKVGTLNGRVQFPLALLGSLLFAVIASPVNERQRVSESTSFIFGKTKVPINHMLGNLEKTKTAIRNGFLYDVEHLLENLNIKANRERQTN